MSKKRTLQDFDKLSNKIKEQVKLSYPEGFTQHLIEYTDVMGNNVSALPFETENKIYLIRMSITVAEQLITDDFDYDDEGFLKEEVKEVYSDKYSDTEDEEEEENELKDDFDDTFSDESEEA